MNRYFLSLLLMLFSASNAFCQEVPETNTDKLFELALREYRTGDFESSLAYTQRGLELAPAYHDIRILQVRNLWALNRFSEADEDLHYLVINAPNYVDVPPLVQQRINLFKNPEEALNFLERMISVYPEDISLKVKKTDFLLKTERQAEARSLAKKIIVEDISGAERYLLENILNRTVKNSLGLNYQYIGFSEEYSRKKPWSTISLEYQRNIGPTAVIGRTTFSDRRYDQGVLYEIEAYPVFSNRFYAFANIGFSDSRIFPKFRSNLSLYYNFAKFFEAEVGSRLETFGSNNYFTAIAGISAYSGKFLFNSRIFLGPERNDQLIQNYQFNTRYYLRNAENFLFLRLGSGISPDEISLSTLLLENPSLDAWYGNLGINKTIRVHHVVRITAGLLHEDITTQRSGTQLTGSIGYFYNF